MQEEIQQKDEKQEYQYFDLNAIKEKLEFSKENWEEGSRLLDSRFVVIENFFTGYYDGMEEMVAQVDAVAKNKKRVFPIMLAFTRNAVLQTECSCPECRQYYYRYTRKRSCAYMAAILQAAQMHLESQNLGDATDKKGVMILRDFQINTYQSNGVQCDGERGNSDTGTKAYQ